MRFSGRISTAASAHAPNAKPAIAHRAVERPRRDAIIAVSGASDRSITIEVASRFAGGSRYPIKAKPEVMLNRMARVVIGLRRLEPYI